MSLEFNTENGHRLVNTPTPVATTNGSTPFSTVLRLFVASTKKYTPKLRVAAVLFFTEKPLLEKQ